jgi:hypothetical protein
VAQEPSAGFERLRCGGGVSVSHGDKEHGHVTSPPQVQDRNHKRYPEVFLAFAVVGALIASRRPRNPIGWILLTDGLLWMLTNMFDFYSIYGVARPGSVPFPIVVAGLTDIEV